MSENNQENKKIIFSAIQPSGALTLGNYIGAIRNWNNLQDEYNCIYSVADLHAITVRQQPAEFACGIDVEKSVLFIQSHNPAHAELAWILNCYTQFGELSRMTQFKDKSAKHADNINAGLFTYPALMAADILLYGSDLVPVGADQKQHLELSRDIAIRFNGVYGDTFTVPDAYITKVGARVMSLQDPTSKMSKSDSNVNGYITLLDDKDTIIRKFKRAITDSEAVIKYADGKDGINNLLTIYSALSGKSIADCEKEFEGKGYGDFKLAVGELVADSLAPIREKYDLLMSDKAGLENIYREQAEKAKYLSRRKLEKVKKKVGFIK
jgi:tryptophanyl-tRNA synthetase